MMNVNVIGIPQLQAALAAKAAQAKAAEKPVEAEGAALLARTAQALAPRLTGALVASIDASGETVVAAAGYAAFQEFGTSKMDAQPFLGPATEMVAPAYERAAQATFSKVVT